MPDVATEDVVVYADPDGKHYVANFTHSTRFARSGQAPLGWLRWPAVRRGWAHRKPCSAELAERCDELPRTLAELALLLSGVMT